MLILFSFLFLIKAFIKSVTYLILYTKYDKSEMEDPNKNTNHLSEKNRKEYLEYSNTSENSRRCLDFSNRSFQIEVY